MITYEKTLCHDQSEREQVEQSCGPTIDVQFRHGIRGYRKHFRKKEPFRTSGYTSERAVRDGDL